MSVAQAYEYVLQSFIIIDCMQFIFRPCFEKIIASEMQDAFGSSWTGIARPPPQKDPPLWPEISQIYKLFDKHWRAVFHLTFKDATTKEERFVQNAIEHLRKFCEKSDLNFKTLMRATEKADAVSKAISVVESFKKVSSVARNYESIVTDTVEKLTVSFPLRGTVLLEPVERTRSSSRCNFCLFYQSFHIAVSRDPCHGANNFSK